MPCRPPFRCFALSRSIPARDWSRCRIKDEVHDHRGFIRTARSVPARRVRGLRQRWMEIIPRCGGDLVGDRMPHEGTDDIAHALIVRESCGLRGLPAGCAPIRTGAANASPRTSASSSPRSASSRRLDNHPGAAAISASRCRSRSRRFRSRSTAARHRPAERTPRPPPSTPTAVSQTTAPQAAASHRPTAATRSITAKNTVAVCHGMRLVLEAVPAPSGDAAARWPSGKAPWPSTAPP